jgi:glucokinase
LTIERLLSYFAQFEDNYTQIPVLNLPDRNIFDSEHIAKKNQSNIPSFLKVTNAKPMIICVDLGGTKIRAGINSGGVITDQRYSLLQSKDSLDETLTQIKNLIAPLIQPGTIGIGIGVPSVVDIEKGIVYNVVNIPSWERVELKAILEKEFGLPVFVNNDVNCFVLGEHHYGLAKGFSTMVGLTLGTGLGSGIIINNQLYTGANCGAGEIGYLPYLEHNLEHYCSGIFFETEKNTTALTAFEHARMGDAKALQNWKEFGIHMGNAIKCVLYAFDPEAVIIGGSVSNAYSFFYESMMQELQDFIFTESLKKLKIILSINKDIQLLGASALFQ